MDYSKVVTFTNISDFDFTPQLGAMFGGVGYPVLAGETKLYPWDLADHLAGALAKQMCLKKDKSATKYDPNDTTGGLGAVLWTEAQIAEIKSRIMGEPIVGEKPVVRTEAEATQAKVAELNQLEPEISTSGYKDKAEVMAELQKKGIQFDARQSKSTLEKMLV